MACGDFGCSESDAKGTTMRRGLLWVLALVLLAGGGRPLDAYEPGTHREIAERAAQPELSSVDRALKAELSLGKGVAETFSGQSVAGLIGAGAFFEDEPVFRVLNHFHDPLRPWQEAGLRLTLSGQIGQSSVLWQQNPAQDSRASGGNWSWQDARQRYLEALTSGTREEREQAFANTFRGLGHLTHLIQDAAVPAHVRNDPHPIYEGYERHIERIRASRPGSPRRVLFESLLNQDPIRPPLSVFTPTGDARAPVPIARLIDSDTFLGENAGVFSSTDLGIAEYTNGNFLSDDTIFSNFALPRRESLGSGFFEPEGQKLRRYFEKAAEGEAVRHFVAESALYDSVKAEAGRPMDEALILTRLVYQDYAGKLLPRAVGYSAALLDYFFRGRLDVELAEDPADPSRLRLTGRNGSSDALVDGVLALYADDPSGLRSPLEALEPVGLRDVAPGQELSSAAFQAPENAERFVAVYQGTLGLEKPEGPFPGGVIGKVLGGVRVEAVFSDGERWKLRTPRGVFRLPLAAAEFEEVRWGDGESLLVARTPLGPDQPNRVAAYEVQRQPGTVEPVTMDTPDGPEAVVSLKSEAAFPFGMALGTSVSFSQTIQYRQLLARVDPHKEVLRWVPQFPFRPQDGIYLAAGVELGPLTVETVMAAEVPFTESFPVTLDLEHNGDFGTEYRPYLWFLEEVAADAAGRLLGLVAVYLTSPRSPPTTLPFFRLNQQGALEVEGPVSLGSAFPPGVDPLLRAVVDLKTREVVASTAEATITLASRDAYEELPDVYVHFTWEYQGGPGPGLRDSGWARTSLRGAEPGTPTVVDAEMETQQGVLGITVAGWLKSELARLGAFDFELGSLRGADERVYDCAMDAAGVYACHAVRVNRSSGVIARRPDRLQDARRARPAPAGERLVLLAESPPGGPERVSTVLAWDPGTSSATALHRFQGGRHWLGPATRSAVLVTSRSVWPVEYAGVLIPLEGGREPAVFPGEDFRDSFTLLDPSYLYSVEDLRFYRLEPPLQRTALPARLADVPGNPPGDYHVIRLP